MKNKTYIKLRIAWHVFWAMRSPQDRVTKLAVAQLRLIGFSKDEAYDEIKNNVEWYSDNAWPNKELENMFADRVKKAMKKKYNLTDKGTAREWGMFNLCYGLRSAKT
jgi:hypothetical protein